MIGYVSRAAGALLSDGFWLLGGVGAWAEITSRGSGVGDETFARRRHEEARTPDLYRVKDIELSPD